MNINLFSSNLIKNVGSPEEPRSRSRTEKKGRWKRSRGWSFSISISTGGGWKKRGVWAPVRYLPWIFYDCAALYLGGGGPSPTEMMWQRALRAS